MYGSPTRAGNLPAPRRDAEVDGYGSPPRAGNLGNSMGSPALLLYGSPTRARNLGIAGHFKAHVLDGSPTRARNLGLMRPMDTFTDGGSPTRARNLGPKRWNLTARCSAPPRARGIWTFPAVERGGGVLCTAAPFRQILHAACLSRAWKCGIIGFVTSGGPLPQAGYERPGEEGGPAMNEIIRSIESAQLRSDIPDFRVRRYRARVREGRRRFPRASAGV